MVVASLVAVINFDVKGGATVEKLVLHPAGLGLVYSKGTGPRGFSSRAAFDPYQYDSFANLCHIINVFLVSVGTNIAILIENGTYCWERNKDIPALKG